MTFVAQLEEKHCLVSCSEDKVNAGLCDCINRMRNEALLQPSVSGSLQEHKQVIRDLMETYIINLDENGSPKASITDIMKLIDRAVNLVGNNR
jgi:hypothetical protein